MQRVLGPDLGAFVRDLHASQGVILRLGCTVARVDGSRVHLAGGTVVQAALIVAGVGVRSSLALAEQAGLAVDRDVSVDAFLRRAGHLRGGRHCALADPHSGERIRVQHWALAQRQGQVAALNILGRRRPSTSVRSSGASTTM
jgi:apoptosis-inducing factor 3